MLSFTQLSISYVIALAKEKNDIIKAINDAMDAMAKTKVSFTSLQMKQYRQFSEVYESEEEKLRHTLYDKDCNGSFNELALIELPNEVFLENKQDIIESLTNIIVEGVLLKDCLNRMISLHNVI